MIVVWEIDETGKPGVILGFFNTDEEFKKSAVEFIQAGKKINAGDVVPFSVNFVPASVKVSRIVA